MFNLDVLFSVSNIILFMAIFTRLSGLFASAPVFSTYPIPTQIKIWLAASIAFILFPMVKASSGVVVPTAVPELTLILIKEFLIGFAIGYCANVILIGVEMGANMFSTQMGLSISSALDPLSGSSSPVLTQAFVLLAGMIFLCVNGHHLLFCLTYTGKEEQVCICAEKPSESVIEDKGDVLVLVFARFVDGEYYS